MKEQERKKGLLKIYRSWVSNESITEFQCLMFKCAIFFLHSGCKPKKVENWVVSIEKKWMYMK